MLVPLEELPGTLPIRGRLMGLDLGTKTIGLAVSDIERRLATPFDTIRRTRFAADVDALVAHLRHLEILALVIGLPLNMDGSEGPRAQSTRSFVRAITPHVRRPIVLWDERLSTVAVTRELISLDVSRAKRATVVDRMAAAYILEGALARLRSLMRPDR